jgi:flavin-dependent dehydrogenase
MTAPARDLLIVGAGPAGLSTALFLLARAPHLADRVEVVDRATFPRDKPCAGAIGARADRLLASIGVRVDVPSAPVDGLSVVFGSGAAQRSIGRIGRVVRRLEFDAELLRTARARGVRVSEGTRVTGLAVERDGVKVETDRGARRVAAVIGADGVGSAVRRALGLPRGHLHAQAVEVDTEVTADDDPSILRFDFTAPELVGYAWDFATLVDGRPMMTRGVYDLDWDRGARVDVAERLRARLAAQGLRVEPARFKRYSVRGLELHRPMSAPRVLLVGEAAGVDPLLGEGIAQGIAHGALAARYLAPRLEARRLDFADWRASFLRSLTAVDLAARTLAITWLRHSPLRRALETLTLTAPEALDVTTALFAGRTPAPRSALLASARMLTCAPRLPLREAAETLLRHAREAR